MTVTISDLIYKKNKILTGVGITVDTITACLPLIHEWLVWTHGCQ